jgi:hypothetical protein
MRDETSERILQAIDYKEKEELNKKIAGLEEIIKGLEKSKKPKKEEKFSHAVQILILEYLDFGKNLDKNKVKAEIYGPLIGRNIEATRQLLSGINEAKNIKNLEIIVEYFNKAGYSEKAKIVEKDIDRIKKKRK